MNFRLMRTFIFIALLFLFVFVIFHNAFSVFFVQDDFIFVDYFSGHDLLTDFKNAFGPPVVTHWRPMHNLFFLISGNLFGKNFMFYHFFTFIIHIAASFLVYKVVLQVTKNSVAARFSGILYAVHPAHFVSLFWISGSATTIGFFFLLLSILFYLREKTFVFLIFFVLSFLSSEAMIVGLGIFLLLAFPPFKLSSFVSKKDFFLSMVLALIFLFLKFVFFTSSSTFSVYEVEISKKTLQAILYYILRVAGFAEVSGDTIISLVLLGWLIFVGSFFIKKIQEVKNRKILFLAVSVFLIGLFPFILIPNHLSGHYMNISIFGFSIAVGLLLSFWQWKVSGILLAIYLAIAILNIQMTLRNNWVTQKSNLSYAYIEKISYDNPKEKSILVFGDNKLSSSKDAYIALGTGKAIKIWFKEKNYKMCFSFLFPCPARTDSVYILF